MIKHFDKAFQETPKSKVEKKDSSIVKRTLLQKGVSERLLTEKGAALKDIPISPFEDKRGRREASAKAYRSAYPKGYRSAYTLVQAPSDKVSSAYPIEVLTEEAMDLMLLNCERKLLKLNNEVVKKDILSIDNHPQNKISLVNQQDLSSSDRLKSAIKRYRYQAYLNPDSAVVQTNLGKLYHKNQQLPEAINCYQNAIAVDSNYAPAHQYLAEIINI
ncbi:MAG: tetratricopeptide repeat protein [Xenococcus sp. (in: cyanobacteria)]